MTSVVVGYCHGQNVDGWFHDCLANLFWRDNRRLIAGYVGLQSGPQIPEARNTIVREYLQSAADYLWMLDADMAFDADILDRLVAAAHPKRRPIVGGLCFTVTRDGRVSPTLRRRAGDRLEIIDRFPLGELVPVDATGAACLLIHRSVLEALTVPSQAGWFDLSTLGGERLGEDLSFCLRARAAGFPIYVHTGIEAGHVKPHAFTSTQWLSQSVATAAGGPRG